MLSLISGLVCFAQVREEHVDEHQTNSLVELQKVPPLGPKSTLLKNHLVSPIQMEYALPVRTVNRFVIDSPFGSISGGRKEDRLMGPTLGNRRVKNTYKLMLCLTGVGFRIEL